MGVWLPWACVAPPPLTSESDAQNTQQNVVLHSHAQEGLQPRGRGGEEGEGEGGGRGGGRGGGGGGGGGGEGEGEGRGGGGGGEGEGRGGRADMLSVPT